LVQPVTIYIFKNWVNIIPSLKPITTYSTLAIKSSTCFSLVVSIGLAKGTSLDHGFLAIGVPFNIVYGVIKTLDACVIISINVTFAPTPIFGITDGRSLGIIGYSNSST
jgi:hypothetical protein